MAWMDNRAWSHPKIVNLSDPAFRVWVNSICYSCGFLTDGRVSRSEQRIIGCSPKIKRELVAAGLWVDADAWIEIHDWDEHNGERDRKVRSRLAKDAARKRKERMEAKDRHADCPSDDPDDEPEDSRQDVPPLTVDRVTVEELPAESEHSLIRLLATLSDADEGTEGTLRSVIKRNALSQGDIEWARECATGPGVRSPSAVAVAELHKRATAA